MGGKVLGSPSSPGGARGGPGGFYLVRGEAEVAGQDPAVLEATGEVPDHVLEVEGVELVQVLLEGAGGCGTGGKGRSGGSRGAPGGLGGGLRGLGVLSQGFGVGWGF